MINQRLAWIALFIPLILVTACRENALENTLVQTPPASPTLTISSPLMPTADISIGNNSNEPVTIHLLVEDYELTTYEQLVTLFEADNPDVSVEILTTSEVLDGNVPSAHMRTTEVELKLAAAQLKLAASADVLAINTSGQTIRQGLRLDLTPLMAGDTSFDPDDFYPHLLEDYQWDGKTWAVPFDPAFNLLVYDKDLFDKAGLSYPTTDWTWEDVLDAALALTIRDNGEVVQWGFADMFFGPVLVSPRVTGPSLLVPNTTSPQPRFEDPDFIEGMQWYTDLFLTHKVAPYPIGDLKSVDVINAFWSEVFNLTQAHKIGMWIGYSGFLTNSFIPEGANWGIVPLPGCAPAYSKSISISAGTQHPTAAWRLISFISQQMVVAGSLNDLPILPVRRSVAEAGGFYDMVRPDLADALQYAIGHACPVYKASESPGAREAGLALKNALGDIFAGNKSVPAALSDAQAEAETSINAMLEAQANATPIPPFTVGAAADTAVSDQPVTAVTFHILGGADEAANSQQIAQAFTAVHPDIAIDVTAVQGDTSLTSNAAQSACFQSAAGFAPGELDAVLSLDPLLDADPDMTTGDFYPSALSAFSADGRLWALPGQMDIAVMAYNKDLFDAAGLPYPQPGWTTADFLTIAQALATGAGDAQQFGYLPGAFESTDLPDWLERLGGNLLDDSQSPPALALNDPSAVSALQWYADLTTRYGVRPAFADGAASLQNSDERRALIEDGRAAMWLDSSFSQGGRPLNVANIGYIPLPVGADGRSSLSAQSMTGYFISAGADAEQRQACWQWISYLTTRPDADVGLPARVSTAVAPDYAQLAGEEKAAAQVTAVTNAENLSLSARLAQEQPWLLLPFRIPNGSLSAQLLNQIINEHVPVAQALADAQGQLDAYRQCVIESGATAVPGAQLSCWRQAAP